MIRVEAFIEDKKVSKVMYALDGLVVQVTFNPVRNAVVKGNKVIDAGNPSTGREAILHAVEAAIRAGASTITTKALMEYGATYGIRESAMVNAIGTTTKGLLKRKSRGVYNIVTKTGEK